MEAALKPRPVDDLQAVGLKAYSRVADAWSLTVREAAGLCDMSDSSWKRAKSASFRGELTRDQLLRLSALIGIYKSLQLYFSPDLADRWIKLPNTGPEFDGQRPIDAMIDGGLPKILSVRTYLDALRGGA